MTTRIIGLVLALVAVSSAGTFPRRASRIECRNECLGPGLKPRFMPTTMPFLSPIGQEACDSTRGAYGPAKVRKCARAVVRACRRLGTDVCAPPPAAAPPAPCPPEGFVLVPAPPAGYVYVVFPDGGQVLTPEESCPDVVPPPTTTTTTPPDRRPIPTTTLPTGPGPAPGTDGGCCRDAGPKCDAGLDCRHSEPAAQAVGCERPYICRG